MNFKQTAYRRFCAIVACLLAIIFLNPSAYADTFHVDGSSGSDTNDGSTWSNAFKTVRKALDEASIGAPHEIFVAAGTYYPDEINGVDSDDRADTFSLVDDVKLYGGFLNGDLFEDRDPETNITILSGDIDQNDDPENFPNGPTFAGNAYHVVIAQGVFSATVLNGFTITAAWGIGTNEPGGGMRIIDASPAVVRCIFERNKAGGPFDPTEIRGGGIYIAGNAIPAIVNCSFFQNTAFQGGGVASAGSANHTLTNCLFSGNFVGDSGGGVYVTLPDHTVTLINCTFVKNEVTGAGEGGGLSVGGLSGDDSNAIVRNCIFWGNLDGEIWGYETHEIFGGISPEAANVMYTCIEDGWPGPGSNNIEVDPMFSSPGNDNYRLYYGSPCIDAADNDALPIDPGDIDEDGITNEVLPLDLDLIERQTDDPDTSDTGNGIPPIVDMGVYEFAPCPADIDGDCVVSAADLVILLAGWGDCAACEDCPADINDDCTVGAADLLILLADWGICSCSDGTGPLTLEDELALHCLDLEDWANFEDKMQNGSEAEKDNYLCWMLHYLEDCSKCFCTGQSGCPGADPFN